jgi:hypothetical protein
MKWCAACAQNVIENDFYEKDDITLIVARSKNTDRAIIPHSAGFRHSGAVLPNEIEYDRLQSLELFRDHQTHGSCLKNPSFLKD